MPHVYSLTHLTGARRNEDRRTVVFTFEVRRYTFIVVIMSLLASAFPTLLATLILGPFALAMPALFVGAGIVLWDTRQRSGLKLKNYQAILDRKKAKIGVLYASGNPIVTPELVMHQMVVIPARPESSAPVVPETSRRRRGVHAKELLE